MGQAPAGYGRSQSLAPRPSPFALRPSPFGVEGRDAQRLASDRAWVTRSEPRRTGEGTGTGRVRPEPVPVARREAASERANHSPRGERGSRERRWMRAGTPAVPGRIRRRAPPHLRRPRSETRSGEPTPQSPHPPHPIRNDEACPHARRTVVDDRRRPLMGSLRIVDHGPTPQEGVHRRSVYAITRSQTSR